MLADADADDHVYFRHGSGRREQQARVVRQTRVCVAWLSLMTMAESDPTGPAPTVSAADGDGADFEHCCFISYRHGSNVDDFVPKFVQALDGELKNHTKIAQPVFCDRTGLGGIDLVERLFAKQCRSVCMISIFTPYYFDQERPFCAREWMTMASAEKAVRPKFGANWPNKGLIVPVIYRHPLPKEIERERIGQDISRWLLPDIEKGAHTLWFQDLARQIVAMHAMLRKAGIKCHAVPPPTNDEVTDFIATLPPFEPEFP